MEPALTTMDHMSAAVQMVGRDRTVKSVRIFKNYLKRRKGKIAKFADLYHHEMFSITSQERIKNHATKG